MTRLSQAIAEGDGITILVEVESASEAADAERQGADGLVVGLGAGDPRASAQLPLLHRGDASAARAAGADAVVVADLATWDEAHELGLEPVVRVQEPDELVRALEALDPEIFLLAVERGSDEDPLESLLTLLHDVPAGKLAIAELRDASAEDVAELERAGVDAVLVATTHVAMLVGDEPPEV